MAQRGSELQKATTKKAKRVAKEEAGFVDDPRIQGYESSSSSSSSGSLKTDSDMLSSEEKEAKKRTPRITITEAKRAYRTQFDDLVKF